MKNRTVALVLAGVGLLAGCGSSGSKDTAAATTAAKSASATTAKAAAGAATTSGSADSTDATATTDASASLGTKPADTKPVDTNFTGAGSDAFCSMARDLEKSDVFNGSSSSNDPATLKADYAKFIGLIKDITAKAPSEIKPDFQTASKAFTALGDAYAKYDWDPSKLAGAMATDTALASLLNSSDMDASTTRIDAYMSKICGISSSSDSTDTPATTG